MKGMDTMTVIGIIIVVIVGLILLYIFWTKGMLPFMTGSSEAQCKATLLSDCDKISLMGGWEQISSQQDLANIFSNIKGCKKFLGDDVDTCTNPSVGFDFQKNACQRLCESVGSMGAG